MSKNLSKFKLTHYLKIIYFIHVVPPPPLYIIGSVVEPSSLLVRIFPSLSSPFPGVLQSAPARVEVQTFLQSGVISNQLLKLVIGLWRLFRWIPLDSFDGKEDAGPGIG